MVLLFVGGGDCGLWGAGLTQELPGTDTQASLADVHILAGQAHPVRQARRVQGCAALVQARQWQARGIALLPAC